MLEFSAGISQTWAEKASGPGFGSVALGWVLDLYSFWREECTLGDGITSNFCSSIDGFTCDAACWFLNKQTTRYDQPSLGFDISGIVYYTAYTLEPLERWVPLEPCRFWGVASVQVCNITVQGGSGWSFRSLVTLMWQGAISHSMWN